MLLKIGDKVRFLNECGGGVIRKINNNIAIVEIENGFEIPFLCSELVNVEINHQSVNFNSQSSTSIFKQVKIEGVKIEKVKIKDRKPSEFHKKSKSNIRIHESFQEIDLHIESLVSSHKGLSNGEIIVIQLNYFENKLQIAIRNKISKLIVIHGVGNGILRQEIRRVLSNYSSLSYYDAPFYKYGFGATEVKIYH